MNQFILITIVILTSRVLSASPIIIDNELSKLEIGSHLEYLEDKNKIFSVRDITSELGSKKLKWKKTDNKELGFGFTKSVYWVRFTVKNLADNNIEWYLEQQYPLIDYLNLCILDKNNNIKTIKTGDHFIFSQRPIEYHTFVFPQKTGANNTNTYFLRYETSSSLHISLVIWSSSFFTKHKENKILLLWMFYIIFLLMFIYHLIIFLYSRDRSYFFYILYIASFGLLMMSLNGTAFQYLWPGLIWWPNICIPVLIGLTTCSVIQFSRYFIRTPIVIPKGDFILKILMITALVILFLTLISNSYFFGIISTTALAGISAAFGFFLVLYICYNEKYRSREAIFFLVAFSLFLFGIILYVLKTFSLLPETFFTSYAIQIGATMEVVLLSLALADKINIMRKKLQVTEKKYRYIVESSNDIIFTLDDNLNFLSVNKAMKKILGFSTEEVINKNFLDFIIQGTEKGMHDISRKLVEKYTTDLINSKKSVNFRMNFRTRHSHEPKELSVKLEYAQSEKKKDILGNASIITDDIIL